MGSGRKILLVVAILFVGAGAFGVYRASPIGKEIIDGTIVEVAPHTGARPTCVANGRRTRRCFRPNGTEPYTYYTETVEFKAPHGKLITAEDPRQRGGSHDSLGDEVKVIVAHDGGVEIVPQNSMLVSIGVFLLGLGLLSLVLVPQWVKRRPAEDVASTRS
jgi:hypothetical protein